MTTIIVTTQHELDDAISSGVEEIEIRSTGGVWLQVRDVGEADVRDGGQADVHAGGQAYVHAGGQAYATGAATIHAHGGHIRAGSHVAVHLHSSRATVDGGVVIDHTAIDKHDPTTWAAYHAAPLVDGHLAVYKAVRDDLRSAHDFAYPIAATVACDDWRDDHECGHGLHFSPTPRDARQYDEQAARYLECRVAVADARPLTDGGAPKLKTRTAVVVREVDLDGQPVDAAEAVAR